MTVKGKEPLAAPAGWSDHPCSRAARRRIDLDAPRLAANQSWHRLADRLARQAGILNAASISAKFRQLRQRIGRRQPAIERIALALYDPRRGCLRNLVDSDHDELQSLGSGFPLADWPALAALVRSGTGGLLAQRPAATSTNAERLCQAFASSVAHPITLDGTFFGVLLFDSATVDAFSAPDVEEIGIYAELLSTMVAQELSSVQMFVGGLQLARNLAHLRDIETGAHLDRMAHYARLIAREIAAARGLDDEFVEHVFLFAPLHDIGKVGVPDCILLKPSSLSEEEKQVMDGHVALGLDMIDRMIADFGLSRLPQLELLRNIVAHHHEYLDGSGYPQGLAADAIPLEARIVATADVLDALCCRRRYKRSWPMAEALEEVARMSGSKLDRECVAAVLRCREEVEAIHRRFDEGTASHPG